VARSPRGKEDPRNRDSRLTCGPSACQRLQPRTGYAAVATESLDRAPRRCRSLPRHRRSTTRRRRSTTRQRGLPPSRSEAVTRFPDIAGHRAAMRRQCRRRQACRVAQRPIQHRRGGSRGSKYVGSAHGARVSLSRDHHARPLHRLDGQRGSNPRGATDPNDEDRDEDSVAVGALEGDADAPAPGRTTRKA
jgi:hypothetical protein